MLPLETLMRAAEGGEREADLVRADFQQAGADAWLRAAMERRLDPVLVARVVPAGASAAVRRALEAFYALWGRWYPAEYRRVRREWVVLQARWRGDAPVDPVPAVDAATSRLLGERLGDVPTAAIAQQTGGIEAEPEPAGAAEGDGGRVRPEPDGAPAGGPGGERESSEVRGEQESSRPGAAPLVGAGGAVAARLPDGTEILADHGGLALSAVGDRLDEALRGGAAAVERVRASWVSGSGAWCRWPAPGRWQERSR